MRQFEASDFLCHGSRKRALLVAEQLAFEQAGGNRRAVYFHETAFAAAAHLVNGPGDQFLSHPGFAQNQDR